jgi:hypothetical protein
MMLNQQRARSRVVPRRFGPGPFPGSSSTSIIPYEYAAKFELKGIPGNIVQDVINIGVEGVFVAVAIGYGFQEERGRSINVIAKRQSGQPSGLILPADVTLGEIPLDALIEGFRINPRFHSIVFEAEQITGPGPRASRQRDKKFSDQPIPRASLSAPDDERAELVFERIKSPQELSFLFSIVDSGTGRELQDEPTHNIASLGTSTGQRPFRLLAQPLTFLPRSTIRLQIIEHSEGIKGTLFIVLYGYKILGASSCPEPLMRSLRGSPVCPTETIGSPRDRTIPFDYVARVELIGDPKNRVEIDVPINVEGGFVATAMGYGLAVTELNLTVRETAARLGLITNNKVNLSTLPLRIFPTNALTDGIRIRPNFLRIVFENNGDLSTTVPANLLDRIFEPLNRPEDVSFRYTIFDSGRGVELQNQPIHSIAGLGIANGERPFKRFARPMIFLPRSSIRITIEEHFGRGSLFLVFQGYKVLGTIAGMGGRP